MGDFLFDLEVETVDAYGFELCLVANSIDVHTLMGIISHYLHSQELLLERLRLKLEAFLNSTTIKPTENKYVTEAKVAVQIHTVTEAAVAVQIHKEQASMETTIEKIRSLKVNESAKRLQTLMLMVTNCGIERCALAFKVEETKILEIVSCFRSAMGSRLERLKKKQDAFFEKRELVQDFDLNKVEEEWDNIYTLLNQIEETAAKHYGRPRTI